MADCYMVIRLGPPAKGGTIHRSTCIYAKRSNTIRWRWADLKGFDIIDWNTMRRYGLLPGKCCHPELLSGAPVGETGS